jgi:AbiV family abortive infection protein
MGLGQKRNDLQANAQAKLDDAIILLQNGRYSNAYYLAGYAVEIGLKACIAARITAETIPDKEFIKGILNHQFTRLVGLAGLSRLQKNSKNTRLVSNVGISQPITACDCLGWKGPQKAFSAPC